METILNLMPWIWGALILLTIVIELITTDIDAIWFAGGSVVALALSFFKLHIAIQLSAFVGVTAILIFTVGLWVKKLIMMKNIPANSDSLIGKEILVLEDVNEFGKGSGVINDVVWIITCQAGVSIKKGESAIIMAIDGNKLVVTTKE